VLQLILLCCLLLCPGYRSGPASVVDFATRRERLEEAYLPVWSELASEANTKKAFATRNRCYRAILGIDPDHLAARRGLKYKRVDGEWVENPSRRPAKDAKSKTVEKLAAEVDASILEYRDAVLALIEKHAEELGPGGVVDAQRRLLVLDSESALIHGLLGEIKLGEQWMLVETARSIERREALRMTAKASYEALESPASATPDGFEVELGIDWTAALETERVRVLGTGEPQEVEQILRAAHAMHGLIIEALGREVALDRHFTLYSLARPKDLELLFNQLPTVRKDPSAAITQATGGWLGLDSRFGNWSLDRPRRVDGSIRGVVSQYLKNGFRIGLRNGWASEGLGLYLVEVMVGTRLTWFEREERYVDEERAGEKEDFSLESTELNWMVEGRELLTAEDAPRLGALIGRPVGTMSSSDLLHAYLLASFLIEGRSQQLPALLDAIGAWQNPTLAFERILGEGLPNLETRLRRWVVEISQYEEASRTK